MKKLAIILLGLFPLVLSSCLKEEEDYFDKSASARIEEAVKNAISVLEGAENGWAVKYYPNPTQTFGGFNLFFKFDDGTVTVSSEIESASTTATSLYSVGQEAGPTLAMTRKRADQTISPTRAIRTGTGRTTRGWKATTCGLS